MFQPFSKASGSHRGQHSTLWPSKPGMIVTGQIHQDRYFICHLQGFNHAAGSRGGSLKGHRLLCSNASSSLAPDGSKASKIARPGWGFTRAFRLLHGSTQSRQSCPGTNMVDTFRHSHSLQLALHLMGLFPLWWNILLPFMFFFSE